MGLNPSRRFFVPCLFSPTSTLLLNRAASCLNPGSQRTVLIVVLFSHHWCRLLLFSLSISLQILPLAPLCAQFLHPLVQSLCPPVSPAHRSRLYSKPSGNLLVCLPLAQLQSSPGTSDTDQLLASLPYQVFLHHFFIFMAVCPAWKHCAVVGGGISKAAGVQEGLWERA